MAYYTTRDVETSQKESVRFSDIDLNFDMNPITKDINTLKNEEAVKRSVRNIVLTNFGRKVSPFFLVVMSSHNCLRTSHRLRHSRWKRRFQNQ